MSTIIEEKVTEKTKLAAPKKYNIWAIDNDFTSVNEVILILIQSFGMSPSVASELTHKVNKEGKAKVNPKPMPKGLAEAQLNKVNNVKRALAEGIPSRKREIMMLKFVIKED